MKPTYGQGDQRIQMSVGDAVHIELPANPTTGFRWTCREDHPLAEIQPQPVQPGGQAVGAATVQRFVVRGLKPGKTVLHFQYAQPWEGQPSQTHDFQLDIQA